MKKIKFKVAISGLVFISLLSGTLTQCSAERADGSLRNSVIWRISGKDLPSPSYLFGTVHVIDSSDFSIHSTVKEQLVRSDQVVFESNLSSPDYQQRALAFAMMENDSLDGMVSGTEYENLKRFFREEFNFPLDAVKQMKPFYLASLIGALEAGNSNISHESEFMRIAGEEGKSITGISTLEKEAETISGIAIQDQVAYLLDEVKSYRSGHSEWVKKEIWQAYDKADLDRIYTLLSASLENHPSVFKQLFVVRNESWLPAMIELMKDQSCFFAVGVGHLPGESGLIRLLRKNGYRVRPVRKDFWFHTR